MRGDDGEAHAEALIAAIARQVIVENDPEIASALSRIAVVRRCSEGDVLITQGAGDTDMILILHGSARIEVNGRAVNYRAANQHVGEMTLIDTTEIRSASVIAHEPSTVACLSEPDFTAVANRFPVLWRRLAIQMGRRLNQRFDATVARVPGAR